MATVTSANRGQDCISGCGYCMEKLSAMEDPRQLECSHVFCLPCLEGARYDEEWIECPHCNQLSQCKDLSKLPKMKTVTGNKSVASKGPCDVCKVKKSSANVFCIDCEKRFCTAHKEKHDNFYKEFHSKNHETVPIAMYQEKPQSYMNGSCPQHTNEIAQSACCACWNVFCSYCEISDDCSKTGGHHKLLKIQAVAGQLRKEKGIELSNLSKKIEEAARVEKEAHKDGEEIADEVEALLQIVKDTAESQICTIQQQADAMLKELRTQLTQNLHYVESVVSSTENQRLQMKADKAAGLKEMEVSIAVDLVRKRKAASCLPIFIKPYYKAPRLMTLESADESHRKLCLTLTAQPPDELTDPHHVSCVGNAVCWNEDGKMVICERNGLLVASRNDSGDDEGISSLLTYNSVSISRQRNEYVIVDVPDRDSKIQPRYVVRLLNSDFTSRKEIAREFTGLHPLTATTDRAMTKIMILESTTLHVYNGEGRCLSTTKLPAPDPVSRFGKGFSLTPARPQTALIASSATSSSVSSTNYIHAISDDAIIVCDPSTNRVDRYDSLQSQTPTRIWCKSIPNPVAVSSDAMGYLYVASGIDGRITVLSSSKGEILKELLIPYPDVSISDLSVLGNEIAVCCKDRGVILFRIQRNFTN